VNVCASRFYSQQGRCTILARINITKELSGIRRSQTPQCLAHPATRGRMEWREKRVHELTGELF